MIRLLFIALAVASCIYCARKAFEDWDEERKLMSFWGAIAAFTSFIMAAGLALPYVWRE